VQARWRSRVRSEQQLISQRWARLRTMAAQKQSQVPSSTARRGAAGGAGQSYTLRRGPRGAEELLADLTFPLPPTPLLVPAAPSTAAASAVKSAKPLPLVSSAREYAAPSCEQLSHCRATCKKWGKSKRTVLYLCAPPHSPATLRLSHTACEQLGFARLC
jgi:hypothetical protein